MARWIVWLRLEAPDLETVQRRVAIHFGEIAQVERIQSDASYRVSLEEISALKRRTRQRFTEDCEEEETDEAD